MKRILIMILSVLFIWATPMESAMIVSDPAPDVDYWTVKVNGVEYDVPPEGLGMLMLSLDGLDPGVHQIEITGYVDELPTKTVKFEIVKELSKKGTIYMAMVDETNANSFQEPLTIIVPTDNPIGGNASGGPRCFIGTLLGD